MDDSGCLSVQSGIDFPPCYCCSIANLFKLIDGQQNGAKKNKRVEHVFCAHPWFRFSFNTDSPFRHSFVSWAGQLHFSFLASRYATNSNHHLQWRRNEVGHYKSSKLMHQGIQKKNGRGHYFEAWSNHNRTARNTFYRLMCWHISRFKTRRLCKNPFSKCFANYKLHEQLWLHNLVSPTTALSTSQQMELARTGLGYPILPLSFHWKAFNSTNMYVSMSFFSFITEQFLLFVPFWFLLIVGRGGAGCMLLLHV